jgi:hypothetical protein
LAARIVLKGMFRIKLNSRAAENMNSSTGKRCGVRSRAGFVEEQQRAGLDRCPAPSANYDRTHAHLKGERIREPAVSRTRAVEATFGALADAAWSSVRGAVPGLRLIFISTLLLQLTFQTFTTWFSLHGTERFGVRAENVACGPRTRRRTIGMRRIAQTSDSRRST